MEKINIYKYSRLSQSEILNLCKRAESNLSDYFEIVDEIIKNVEENKENALVEYSKKLDNVKSGLREFKVSEEEFSRAHDLIDEDMKEALIFCSANVKKFHEAQMPKKEWMIEMHPGVLAGEKNIREVTMFPMNQNAEDLMMNAPSRVSESQLKELNLSIKNKK